MAHYEVTTATTADSILVSKAVCPDDVENGKPRVGYVTRRQGYTAIDGKAFCGRLGGFAWHRPLALYATSEEMHKAAARLARMIRRLSPLGGVVQVNDRHILPFLEKALGA